MNELTSSSRTSADSPHQLVLRKCQWVPMCVSREGGREERGRVWRGREGRVMEGG